MIYTPEEYVQVFTFAGKHVSVSTLKRRMKAGMFPKNHIVYKKPHAWIIEVPEINANILANYNLNLTLKK
jgi:hypothetical protein